MPFRIIERGTASHASIPASATRLDPPARRRRTPPSNAPACPPPPANSNPDPSYKVGKGRPPIEYRFQKGRSGNPKGRPKGAKGVNTLAIEILGAKVPVRTPDGEQRMNAPQIALNKLRTLSAKGELPAILAVLRQWAQAVPDHVAMPTEQVASLVLTPAEQQLLDMMINNFGIVDDRIVTLDKEDEK
jgi:hypothetical protein